MSQARLRARHIRLGAFILGAVAIAVIFVVAFGAGWWWRPKVLMETYFDESVQGIDVSSPLKYRGVNVGVVSRIGFTYTDYEQDKPAAQRSVRRPACPVATPDRHPQMTRLLRSCALVALLCSTAACGLTAPAPARNTWLPRADVPQMAHQTGPVPGLLLVNVFSVAEAFAGKPMVYRFDEHRYETDFYNEFLVAPRDFVSQSALEWMQRADVFESVAPAAGARAPRAMLLQGSVNELYADVREARRPMAVVAIQFYLVDETQPSRPLRLAEELRRSVPIPDASAAAYAQGVSRALTEIFGELEQRLRSMAGAPG